MNFNETLDELYKCDESNIEFFSLDKEIHLAKISRLTGPKYSIFTPWCLNSLSMCRIIPAHAFLNSFSFFGLIFVINAILILFSSIFYKKAKRPFEMMQYVEITLL